MRGQLRLKNGVIVREIRPLDFKNALTQLLENGDRVINEVTGEEWEHALLINTDLMDISIRDFNVTEQAKNKQAFIKLNACFFMPEKTQLGSASAASKTLIQLEADLNLICVALIERRHRDCWSYGWQFFLAAQAGFGHE